ncbi:MAG: hypothetical protein II453_21255 [Alphaproteobacteria bacterium]|nr:hypothetical protein [Alphaproteobacteria bacterium]MBQ3944667.1 hypothetical protein [Alphaproteobacteria bacterium]
MTIHLYKHGATPKRIDKSTFLNDVGEISGVVLKETENELTPDFILNTNSLVYNANYFFCDFTSRYYYITDMEMMTGGRIVLHSRVDVLMTFRNEILSSSSWVEVSDKTSDTSDNYDMLHNDFPFRQDYDILGKSATDSIFWSGNQSGNNIVLIMK